MNEVPREVPKATRPVSGQDLNLGLPAAPGVGSRPAASTSPASSLEPQCEAPPQNDRFKTSILTRSPRASRAGLSGKGAPQGRSEAPANSLRESLVSLSIVCLLRALFRPPNTRVDDFHSAPMGLGASSFCSKCHCATGFRSRWHWGHLSAQTSASPATAGSGDQAPAGAGGTANARPGDPFWAPPSALNHRSPSPLPRALAQTPFSSILPVKANRLLLTSQTTETPAHTQPVFLPRCLAPTQVLGSSPARNRSDVAPQMMRVLESSTRPHNGLLFVTDEQFT